MQVTAGNSILDSFKTNTPYFLKWLADDIHDFNNPEKKHEFVNIPLVYVQAVYSTLRHCIYEYDISPQESHLIAGCTVCAIFFEDPRLFSPQSVGITMRRDALWVLMTMFLIFLLKKIEEQKEKELNELSLYSSRLETEKIRSLIALVPVEMLDEIKATKKGESLARISLFVPKTSSTKVIH